ncbi:unnamed protein product [Microthlaspi erraticum]|uniref:Uncharacterized protein n=1 Tax=Microthlaspi erraticum TaxID=1685480 RepID=A0A6D2J0C5_9BRAS|nr:unnamed protein product [Microthlaspi erraticum]
MPLTGVKRVSSLSQLLQFAFLHTLLSLSLSLSLQSRFASLFLRECRNMYLKAEHKCSPSSSSEVPSPSGPLLSLLLPHETSFLSLTSAIHPCFHTFQPSSSLNVRKKKHDLCEDG